MNNLILGDGQLGTVIRELTGWNYISRKQNNFDANQPDFSLLNGYDNIINCIAHTDTYSENREQNWNINYKFVVDLVDTCNLKGRKLIHISTDYLYSNSKSGASEYDVPVHCRNWYGYTKLLGDAHVQLKAKDYLIIRCSFKPDIFPYQKAIVNQVGNFDSTSVIAKLICRLINTGASGIYNVGTEPKTIYDLAKRTRIGIEPMYEKLHETMPTDITMNLFKLNQHIERSQCAYN